MRRIFIVLAKLIGLFQIYWGLTYLASVIFVFSQISGMESSMAGTLVMQVVGILGYGLISFCMAWLLIARTDWLADKLKIPADDPLPALSSDVVLQAGIKIVGIYMLAHAIPALVKAVTGASVSGMWDGRFTAIWTKSVPIVFQVAIGLLLVIRTDRVLALIARGEKMEGIRIIVGGLVLLVLLVLIVQILTHHPWLQHEVSYSSAPVYISQPNDGTGHGEKDHNPSASRDGDILYGQAMSNSIPDFTNASISEIVNFLKQETTTVEQIPSDDPTRRIRKMSLIDDRKTGE